ncbi:GIY-YIG nuclease family protein [Methylomonas koyamae]|uniref:GIY-YIG nuclease family protein n=1 Tax=Methylomonas koyamae TaxID=702114 RepID=UPI002873A00D|nr:GIY-YIG nuclease family protein [Methylomonas koyamae]WNB74534.1 GIY-YIG nuclease family protein [Methylomonas koyamae]
MPIIKNYGFLWDRDYIYRGAGSNSGHLKGVAPGVEIADFREQIGVYVLYDLNQKIVYVGQAGNGNATLFTRLKNHMDGKLWNRWQYFSWIGFRDVNVDGSLSSLQSVDSGVSGFKYSDALNEIEGILIEVIEPKLNKQSGRLKKAKEYFQYRDERLVEKSNSDLFNELKQIRIQLQKQ